MSRKVDIPMICKHTYDSDAVERQEAPPKDQRKQVASHRIPGRGSSQQPARNFRMATSPYVDEQQDIAEHKRREEEANYAAFTNYSGTLDRRIPIARKVEPPDEEERSVEEREHHRKNFRPARPVVRKDSCTRQNSAEIKQQKRERSDNTTGSKETESRTRAKGESSSNRSRHASSSTRSAPNQNESSSDSEDDRRQPSRHVDKNASDDRGTGNETSDTDDYISPVEFSPHPPAMVGEKERVSSLATTLRKDGRCRWRCQSRNSLSVIKTRTKQRAQGWVRCSSLAWSTGATARV